MRVHVDRWQPLVGHVEGGESILVLPLDRVMELHHGRKRDGDWCEIVLIRSCPVAAT
jgi:hypothetical protein